MNPFRAILNDVQADGLSLQGDQAMLHAVLVVSDSAFENTSPDPHATGALANAVRDALRRWRLMGVRDNVVDRFAAMLNTRATKFDRS